MYHFTLCQKAISENCQTADITTIIKHNSYYDTTVIHLLLYVLCCFRLTDMRGDIASHTLTLKAQHTACCSSVSHSPKKGHDGNVPEKWHFQRVVTCQKGFYLVRQQAKGHMSYLKFNTVVIFSL